jgi:hypothetical protein
MYARCLSSVGPCAQVCDLCIQAHENYLTTLEQQRVSQAIQILTSRGYQIIPPTTAD